ncbi:bile acid:sodium symporter [Dehalogenimonas sp. 4OHTPN]|uniref:Bile acid:sodium symporter n=1 Tax=Dehalogenimonas sp. 4OHTPN TaxID=3166643 RepID=A0AAU8GAW2_9CHLR
MAPLAQRTESWIISLLIIAMSLSLSHIDLTRDLLLPKKILKATTVGFLLNFILLGGLNIVLGYLLTDDKYIIAGLVILAGAPPSLLIAPCTYNIKGDVSFSFLSTIACYFLSILILPLLVYVFLSSIYWGADLFNVIFQIIILPLILSRIIRKLKQSILIQPYNGHIINWCVAIVCFTLIGLNRELLTTYSNNLLVATIVAFATIFVLGESIYRISRLLNIPPPTSISYMLLGSMKKWAGASAIAYVLLGPKASVPAITALVIGFLYYLFLSIRFHKNIRSDTSFR